MLISSWLEITGTVSASLIAMVKERTASLFQNALTILNLTSSLKDATALMLESSWLTTFADLAVKTKSTTTDLANVSAELVSSMLDQSVLNNAVTMKITLMTTTVSASHHAIKEVTRNVHPAKPILDLTQAELIVSAMTVLSMIRMEHVFLMFLLKSRSAQKVWKDQLLTLTVSARLVTFLELDAAL